MVVVVSGCRPISSLSLKSFKVVESGSSPEVQTRNFRSYRSALLLLFCLVKSQMAPLSRAGVEPEDRLDYTLAFSWRKQSVPILPRFMPSPANDEPSDEKQ